MRTTLGIAMLAALVTVGCSSDGAGGINRPAALVVAPDRNETVVFDYLGPLWEPTTDGQLTLPNYSACPGGASEYPFASCIETVTIDGVPADASALKAGQIVEVHGGRFSWSSFANAAPPTTDNPTVTVDIQRAIVGPVEAIDIDHAWMTVLGQRVYADDAAVASTAVGEVVTVYGHFTGTGQIVAELVEPYAGDPLFLLRGVLTEPAPGHFAIGELEVDISSATRENFPGGAPLPGDTVLVRGDPPSSGDVVSATAVRCIGACLSPRWLLGSARGFLTSWRSPTDFDVDGIAVRLDYCDYCPDTPPPTPGTFISVSVNYYGSQVTQASSTSRTIALAGRVTAKDSVLGEIVVHGYRVHVSPATHIIADPDVYFDVLPFDNVNVYDAVEISGQASGAGIRADTIVRQGSANIVKVLDYTLAAPAIEVAGRAILTDSTTRVELCQGDGLMSVSELFAKAWADLHTWLMIIVDPNSDPLVAERVVVCPPEYVEPDFDLYW